MAEVETALMLRLEASLAKFEKQMARGQRVVNKFTTDWDQKFAASNRKMARNAEASALTIGKEMDRLRAKYDPLFAASKQYETELSELNRAQKVGAINTQQYDAALERLNAEYRRATGGAQRLAGATRGMGGGIQNVAYQIGDFAVQVGAGTSASVALGQQLPQLLGGFGALGAVLGAIVAVGVPVAASFLSSGEAAQDLEEKQDELTRAVNGYRSAVEAASMPTEELALKYGTATEAARVFLEALTEISKATALEELSEAQRVGAIDTSRLEELLDVLAGTPEKFRNFSDTYRKAMGELSEGFGVTEEEARSLLAAIREYEAAEGPAQVVGSAEHLLSVIKDVYGPLDTLTGQARALAEEILNVANEAGSLQGQLEQNTGYMQAFIDAAYAAGDAIASAVPSADTMLGRLQALAAAAWDYAGALGASANKGGRGGDPRTMGGSIRDWNNPENRLIVNPGRTLRISTSGGRTGGRRRGGASGNGGAGGRDQESISEIAERELEQMQRKIDMVGKTQAEIATLTAKYKLLDEAKERGLSLDARQAATGETLREQIDRQAASIGDLTEKYEQARERAAFFEGVQQDLKDGFIDAIVEGESLAGVLENLAKSLAKAALQAMLFNEGPFASGTGTGWLGGGGKGGLLGGAIIPGILHSGGTAGKDGYGHGRSVSPAMFNGAPRYHKGGIAGLRPNEVPAILERGERVIPNGQSPKQAGQTFNIYVSGARGNSEIREMVAEGIQQARGGIVKQSVGSAQRSFKRSKSAWSP